MSGLDPDNPDATRSGVEPEMYVGSTKRKKCEIQHLGKWLKELGTGTL